MISQDEKADIVLKVLERLEKQAQDVSEGPIEEMKSASEDLQLSPEGAARKEGVLPDVNELVPTPEDAEGLCVEQKMAKGLPEGQARMECAQGDKQVSEVVPDQVSIAKESVIKDQEGEEAPAEEKPKSCVEKAMEAGKSEEEAKAQCAPKEEAKDAKLDAIETQLVNLIALRETEKQKTAQDSERNLKAKTLLVDSIIEKTNGGYTKDTLGKKSVCYLEALDGFIDKGMNATIVAQSGRITSYPVMKDAEVKPMKPERPYVGVTRDGKDYKRID